MVDMAGRVAVVTGAANGIGRAAARAFAAAGAAVVVTDLDEDHGARAVEEIEAAGGRACFRRVDVADPADADGMVATALERYGALDYAFNNAGIEGATALLGDLSDDDFARIISVNLVGVFNCLRAELRHMSREQRGAIVNNSSIAGLVGFNGAGAYVASKHGVIGLTRTAALDYAPAGIRVNAVCPGVIDTEMVKRAAAQVPGMIEQIEAQHPLGRMGRPEEIASSVVWLCSDDASFVTGQAIAVDGGYVAR